MGSFGPISAYFFQLYVNTIDSLGHTGEQHD